jgi:hypothetical protein
MDRMYRSGAAGSPPSSVDNASSGYPTNGNTGSGTPPTVPGAYWFHQITETLARVIEAAGITLDQDDHDQLLEALQSQGLFTGAAAGDETFASPAISGNTLTLNLNTARVFKVAATANINTTTIQNRRRARSSDSS